MTTWGRRTSRWLLGSTREQGRKATHPFTLPHFALVRACVRACVRSFVRACVCACVRSVALWLLPSLSSSAAAAAAAVFACVE